MDFAESYQFCCVYDIINIACADLAEYFANLGGCVEHLLNLLLNPFFRLDVFALVVEIHFVDVEPLLPDLLLLLVIELTFLANLMAI